MHSKAVDFLALPCIFDVHDIKADHDLYLRTETPKEVTHHKKVLGH